MGLAEEIIAFEKCLMTAVEKAMETDVSDAAKKEIASQLARYTFPFSRGTEGGGLLDMRSVESSVVTVGDDVWLTMLDMALPQEKKASPGALAVAVTEGDPAWRMKKPRPFMEPAEKEMAGKDFRDALAKGLTSQGFTVL